jgi:hypothetical protein
MYEDNNKNYNFRLCVEKHINIEKDFTNVWKEFGVVWKSMNGLDKKLWAIILLLVSNLTGLIIMFLKLNK